jgi:hypothetical protein
MILEKTIERTAQWNKETNAWQIEEAMVYQWYTITGSPKSPIYKSLTDALQWIIAHDEHLS